MNQWANHPEARGTVEEHYRDTGPWKHLNPAMTESVEYTSQETVRTIIHKSPRRVVPEKVARLVASGRGGLLP